MSENTQNASESEERLIRQTMVEETFQKLTDIDRKLFNYGPLYLSGNAALAGMICNSLFRRALNVQQAWITSTLSMALLPFMTTQVIYQTAVSHPLLAGDLNCPTCCVFRGALSGVVGGVVYPILLGLPLNMYLAVRYSTAPMPEKGAFVRHNLDLIRPVLKKMRAAILLQAVFGGYMASKQLDIYAKAVQLTFGQGEKLLDENTLN